MLECCVRSAELVGDMCPQVPTYINNILIGKRNLDHRGSFYVTCLTSGDSFKCKIKEPLFGKGHHDVRPKHSAVCIPDAWVVSRSLEMCHFAALVLRHEAQTVLSLNQ